MMRALMVLAVLSGSGCGCLLPVGDTKKEPGQPNSIRAQLKFDFTYQESGKFFQFPNTLTAVLALEIAPDDRVKGTLAFLGSGKVTMTVVTGVIENGKVRLDEGMAAFGAGGSLNWKRLEVDLHKSLPDGVADTGAGSAEGTVSIFAGDVGDLANCTAKVTAVPDVEGSKVTIEPLMPNPYRFVFVPTDGVRLHFGEPVVERDALQFVRVLANGNAVEGRFSSQAREGRITVLEFQPAALLPYNADIKVDLGQLGDLSGNAMTADASVRKVTEDPGSILTNPGFELGLQGWTLLGKQGGPFGTYQNVVPAGGLQQLVVREETGLSGYFDVPTHATTLSMQVTTLAESDQLDQNYTAVLRLHNPGEAPKVIFDVFQERQASVACRGCEEFTKRMGPLTKTLDLTPYRGKRVFLSGEVRSSFFFGVNYFALLLDEVKVQ